MNSSVVEKIKKLLSLAQSDNPNERDAALAKAHALAAENDVELALLDTSDVGVLKAEALVEDKVEAGRIIDVRTRLVATYIWNLNKVEVIFGWRRLPPDYITHKSVNFLGRKSEVEYAKWLFGYLMEEYVRRWDMERKLNNLPVSHRNTFWLGLSRGMAARAEEEREAAEQAAIRKHATASSVTVEGAGAAPVTTMEQDAKVAELTNRYALAVADEKSVLKKFKEQQYPRLGRGRGGRINLRSHDTYNSGLAHGRSMTVSRPLK